MTIEEQDILEVAELDAESRARFAKISRRLGGKLSPEAIATLLCERLCVTYVMAGRLKDAQTIAKTVDAMEAAYPEKMEKLERLLPITKDSK